MRMSDQQFNRLIVLKKLRAAQPVSRTELAGLSGLTGGTITAIIADLVRRGLIIEEKVEIGGRGRPKINLSINPHGAFVVGATLSDEGPVLIDIVDLNGVSVFSCAPRLAPTTIWDDLAGQLAAVIAKSIEASPVSKENIAQVGIGLSAIIDNRSGTALMMETFEPGPFPFAGAVAHRLGIPVHLDNSMNLLARAEHWFGDATGVDDFTLVILDLALGGACYRDGQLVVGSRGIEAELGHTKIIAENGRLCHCGATGCLQTYCAISGIVGQYREAQGLPELHYLDLRNAFGEMVKEASKGNMLVLGIFQRAGRYLGVGIANHVNMQDPDRIVILCREPDLVSLISAPFFEALQQNILPALYDRTRFAFNELTSHSYSKGAAAMVLEQVYQAA